MSVLEIHEFFCEGGWTGSGAWHVECAVLAKSNFESKLNLLEVAEAEARELLSSERPELIDDLIDHETHSHHADIYREYHSTLLYTCMAIEGFLNLYDTVRLGEKRHKRLLERLGIVEKLCLLCMLCTGEDLNPEDELCRSVRYIFDKRNALVHPKTKEINSDNMHQHLYTHPRDLETLLCFTTLVSFFKYFASIDPLVKIRCSFELQLLGLSEKSDGHYLRYPER